MKPNSSLFNNFTDGASDPSSGGGGISSIPAPEPQMTSGGDTPQVEPGGEGAQQGGGSSGAAPQAAPAAPSLPLDAVMQLMQQVRGPQAQPQQPQMSPADVRKALKAVEVKREWVAKAMESDDPEVRMSAFQEFADAISEHAMTLAQASASLVEQRLGAQLSPMVAAQEAQKMQKIQDMVVGAFPGMKPYENLVGVVANQMKQEGWQSPIGGQQGLELVKGEIHRRMQAMLPQVDFMKRPGSAPQSGAGADFGGMVSTSAPGGAGGSGPTKMAGNWWNQFVG